MTISRRQWRKCCASSPGPRRLPRNNAYRGYFPSSVNGKEGFDISDPQLARGSKPCGPDPRGPYVECNRFPEQLGPAWEAAVARYFDALCELGRQLLAAIGRSFGGDPAVVADATARPASLTTLRFNFYPKRDAPIEVSSDGMPLGCEIHVDSSLLTILYQDRRGGLQVQGEAGGPWLDVPYDGEAFVVNTGRALEALTGGALRATKHRVLFDGEQRVSIPLFLEPPRDFPLDVARFAPGQPPDDAVPSYGEFLETSLAKFVEYDREK